MDMHRLLSAFDPDSGPYVMATVIHTVGHAYRKRGSAMILGLDGTKTGSISPGCLETDLQERAPCVWDSGQAQIVGYNLQPEEDAVWGEALGCGGEIRILLEPVQGELRRQLLDAKKTLDGRRSVRFIRRRLEDGRIAYAAVHLPSAASGEPGILLEEKGGGDEMLTFDWHPQPRLLLFGAGDDSIPIARLAMQSGFAVTVADWRSGLCTPERYPGSQLMVGRPEEIASAFKLGVNDYVVVCSHQLERDRRMIELALAAGARYIGVMGSKKRIALLLGEERPSNVYAPIGCSIGAEGADEIAVSVAAELIAVHRGAENGGRKGAGADEAVRRLFGRGTKPENGAAEAFHEAAGWNAARSYGASCSIR
ncbi:XdhC family protein [Paenibacillus thailandensis]|uniref:XdhC family protein n=1 Tax=Paenibacillus thailandensis TaxID=393250 RepID=A0ABW5R1H8_9BACL